MSRTIGDLTPIREAMDRLDEWERHDREKRGDTDPVVQTLATVRRSLTDALDAAARPVDGLTVEEYADLAGITKFGAYKRIARGQVQAERRGGRLLIQSAA